MPAYKTPGVYVEEISKLPPSVAEVSTAVPAFFGYTKKGKSGDSPVARVTTLLEFTDLFGGPMLAKFTVTADEDDKVTKVERTASAHESLMYYAVSHYFKNGGGACYIVSVGDYAATPVKAHFETALGLLAQEDEPTLIVLTDAVCLDAVGYNDLCQQALAQCKSLGDRFAIFDVKDGKIDDFRYGIGTNYLAYGAAYHPYLQTSLSYEYEDKDVTVKPKWWLKIIAENAIKVRYDGADGAAPKVTIEVKQDATTTAFSVSDRALTITVNDKTKGAAVADAWGKWASQTGNKPQGFEVFKTGDGTAALTAGETPLAQECTLDAIESTNTALYNQIKAKLTAERVVLPPSAAVAGIYASVDRDRGVWKAPANVSVSAVIGPTAKITNDEQEALNVATSGKSINAIRSFAGKGTIVWGARTLAGNDNEWRYVPVRRLFIMIEESARKATDFAVFEPNDMTTWLKVKGMIESFLHGLWERGALAGPTPDAAYFVNVGLGKTMTTQDILEGRMIVEIGVAAVRPAEFIILRFSHKLQQA